MERRFCAIALLTVFLATSAPVFAGTAPLANGGFEIGDFANWTVNDPSGSTFVSVAFLPYVSNSGDYFAALGATGLPGSISQNLITVPGESYAIHFFLASDGASPNQFEVQWDGETIFNQVNIRHQKYIEYTLLVTAKDASTNLTFIEQNDKGFLSLDDVSVNVAPVKSASAPKY